MSSGTRSASTRTAWFRRSSTWTARSTGVTAATSSSTRRASSSGIAADVYRISRDRAFLGAIFEPVVRATRFIEELCARTDAEHGPETRFHGLLAPSISHEGYSKPSYSYWDDYFALSAWRNCEFLAREIGDEGVAAHANAKGREFAANLTRSIRMTAEKMKTDLIPGSADRDDVDPTSTSIAFEPCRVEDALPPELVAATYDRAAARVKEISSPGFKANYSPYDLRNLNAFVSLGRFDDAFRLLSVMLASRRPRGWRGWAEVVWADLRVPEYIGDMPHTWIGAEFFCAVRRMLLRENGATLELFRAVPDGWWAGEGITLNDLPTAFGAANLRARRERTRVTVELSADGSRARANPRPLSGGEASPGGRQPMRHPSRHHLSPQLEPAGNRFLIGAPLRIGAFPAGCGQRRRKFGGKQDHLIAGTKRIPARNPCRRSYPPDDGSAAGSGWSEAPAGRSDSKAGPCGSLTRRTL